MTRNSIEIPDEWLSRQTVDVQAVIRMQFDHIKQQDKQIAVLQSTLTRESSR
ncbi:hypothetical protein [Rubinisphaera italica]|uniref:Uncharacterized protein n=1 Tax=Rubinisphaera italica TaxID=2527969 RepID=A0A5C5XBF3_9PLAN|nr:hypothetical protein [Rubinisphaera italica]TWT59603.1 hypothetical protein Pan54_03110 [Rubinisphaera italica]